MTKEVQILLRKHDIIFRWGMEHSTSAARADLKRGIREAKTAYKRMIEDHFTDNNTIGVAGIPALNALQVGNTSTVEDDVRLKEELNHFFACFEVEGP